MSMEIKFQDLIIELEKHKQKTDKARLKRVYDFVDKKHFGQVRQTGDPYITHPLFVAHALASWGLDQASIEAALLHELPEVGISILQIEETFGKEVSLLVDGVNRVGQVRLRGSRNVEFLENLRKMFVAMAQDIRVVLIRLADRWHNCLTLDGVPLSKQKRIALETLEVYAPLAERLGMGKLKGELEDLVFPYIYPEEYKWVMEIAKPHFKHSEENVTEVINRIRQQLGKHGVKARTEGRPKRKYSLYRKLMRPEINGDIKEIHDLMAIRIITPDTASCYATLGVIHQYWKPVPYLGISDFIAQPKPNGYQSIHTKVFDNKGNIVEIQIRSEAMHLQAELGAAAHFAYSEAKHSGISDAKLEKGIAFKVTDKMAWVNQLAGWQQQIQGEKESLSEFKLDALSHHIYVFSPKGDVYDLPENATPVDYAFNVHSGLGFYIQSVKVNGKIAPIDSKLKSGDLIEIVKTKSAKPPNRNWLRFVKTHKAKEEIRKAIQ
jgi:guanosine-3',5'-bis(diphosphate) 3'-pyrophosphohydrolase